MSKAPQSGYLQNPTLRFSDRVDNYVKYRPTYPAGVIETLNAEWGLTPHSCVADVGSGTGILATLFLENGNCVFGVEPNREMREAGESLLAEYRNFVSVEGTAEATTLPEASVDFVVAGQAFHWFDPVASHEEFRRILRPNGVIVLIWNARLNTGSPFLEGYERLLREHAPEYAQVNHQDKVNTLVLDEFFGVDAYSLCRFPNVQTFDLEGLRGRTLSSSYVPQKGQAGYERIMKNLNDLFERTQENGSVTFAYETEMYLGKL